MPIIIVFTRYDNLVYKEERQLLDDRGTRTKGEIHSLATSIAYQSFENNCLMQMKKVNSSIPCVYVSGEGSFQIIHWRSLTPGFFS